MQITASYLILPVLALGQTVTEGFGITTYAGTRCDGDNQGTTQDYAIQFKHAPCINMSNAGSFLLHKEGDAQCAKVYVQYFHETECHPNKHLYHTHYYTNDQYKKCIGKSKIKNGGFIGSARMVCGETIH